MTLRPRSARWFELLVAHADLDAALSQLAATGAVQLEGRGVPVPGAAAQLARGLDEFAELAHRYSQWWPQPRSAPPVTTTTLAERMQRALEPLRAWVRDMTPRVAALEALIAEQRDLDLLCEFLEGCELSGSPRLDWLARPGSSLSARLFGLTDESPIADLPAGVILHRVDTPTRRFVLAVGERDAVARFADGLRTARATLVELPTWLPATPEAAVAAARARQARVAERLTRDGEELRALGRSPALEVALGECRFLEWFAANVPPLAGTRNFSWVSGWVRRADQAKVNAALQACGIRHVLAFPDMPAGSVAPTELSNPAWARPFEFFVRLLGTPGAREADPSELLAVIAPLAFGFMFGDVGQGAVLLALGLALRRRYPPLTLLVSGGVASIAFGLLFGSVFAREDLLPALWVRPLEAPLEVLGASLALGVLVVSLGLWLEAASQAWSGAARHWLIHRSGAILLYLGGVAAWWWPAAGASAAALGALLLLLLPSAWAPAGQRLPALGAAAGELAELGLQLAVNTVSFLRVGAFALAHAGLAVAVVALAEAGGSWPVEILILAVGNLFIIALEALVVGIQTTRLVLFEFFIRFLRGTGRRFSALPPLLLQKSTPEGDSR